jgi:hypothetical protein
MTEVHNVTDAKESKSNRTARLKKAGKYAALTVFGGAVALVVLDKAGRRGTKTTHTVTETEETTES